MEVNANTSAMSVKLDCLPVEIIQRIVSYGPCESALILTRVNKTLRAACNDRQVFRAILRNRNGHGGPRWDNIPLSNDSPTSSWARYALADSKAGELAVKEPQSQISLPPDFHLWVPQLMISSHPLLSSVDPVSLYMAFENAVGDESYALAIRLTLNTMSHSTLDSMPYQDWLAWHDAEGTLREVLNHGLDGPIRGLEGPILIVRPIAVNTSDPQKNSREQCARAIVAVAVMFELLRPGDYTHERVITPTASDIDFHAMADLPLPFSFYAPAAMAAWHLPRMTSSDFLEDGEWMGVYSFSLGARQPISWDPPMRGIQFTTRTNSDLSGRVFLKASGTDHVGPFELDGCLFFDNGLITMTKTYGPHLRWYWNAFMTPFGIVGTWGHSGWGGWVWLWKASWRSGQV